MLVGLNSILGNWRSYDFRKICNPDVRRGNRFSCKFVDLVISGYLLSKIWHIWPQLSHVAFVTCVVTFFMWSLKLSIGLLAFARALRLSYNSDIGLTVRHAKTSGI